ncbi:MAG: hypothetical protein JRS35_09635 [Deltaproteobacteria bacterium]|nr:hypothetical protein [Deltaproteobacteria bacterium]
MVVAGIVALWIAFAATHMGLSSLRLRPRLVERLGERGFQGVYSLVALVLFVSLVRLYASHKHAGPELWSLGELPGVQAIMFVGMAVALVLAVAGILTPSPAALLPGKTEVKGVFCITRHPLFMGIGLFGLMHLLGGEIHTAELAFFGGFVVFTLLACRHQDQRKLATAGEEFRRFHEQTPFLPFTGPGSLQGLKQMPLAIAVGIVVTAVLRYFHPTLFGGA